MGSIIDGIVRLMPSILECGERTHRAISGLARNTDLLLESLEMRQRFLVLLLLPCGLVDFTD